jgi:tetratricopeptide (TPR) repeat protein
MKVGRFTVLSILLAANLSAQQRFDYLVREDFFAGLTGNAERLQRAMATTERILAESPDHAEALVWHGMGTVTLSQQEFRKGNRETGQAMFQRGLAEMDRAARLQPDNIGVRIPRGAVLRDASRAVPPELDAALLENARSDFQRAFDLQKANLPQVAAPHPLGELLQGLGDIYSRQDKPDEAAKYYSMILERLPGTEYARRATEWMETRQPLPAARTACYGCHVSKQ